MKIQRYAILTLAIFLAGCGRLSNEKGLIDCQFEASKVTASHQHQNDITFMCMSALTQSKSGDGVLIAKSSVMRGDCQFVNLKAID